MRIATTLALVAFALTVARPSQAQGVALTPLANGLPSPPVAITNAHDGSGRLFITLQDGRVMLHDGCAVRGTPFLDIRSVVLSGGEQGLLSVAFHPAFPTTPYVYVYYTRKPDGAIVIARYRLSTGNPDVADAASGVVLLVIPHPTNTNHNGGQLQFSPTDGYLYIGTGDGGSANDPPCNAQRDDVLLGKMLRIDVDQNFDVPPFYGIPPTNPFVGAGDPPDEVWAKGVRNPFRFSFDRTSGDLIIGDVGQGAWEEVDVQAPGVGGRNYGWKVMEGNHCTGNSTTTCPANVPACNAPGLTLPVLEYDHSINSRCSITGGYRYRGAEVPALAGAYVYGDYCSREVFTALPGSGWSSSVLLTAPGNISAFGEDEAGELLLASYSEGAIYRLVATSPSADLSLTKTDGQTTVISGQPVTYTITAHNAGPTTAYAATVTDTFPAALVLPAWTCSASSHSSCCGAASGNGNLSRPVLLASGGTVTYTVATSVNAGFTGALSNTATIAAAVGLGDAVPGNNSATDTDTVVPPTADLSITKSDGQASVTAGGLTTYTIVASSAGPSDVSGVTVTDTFPAAIASVSWTCTATAGSSCGATSGTGNLAESVDLAAGGSVTYSAEAVVSPGASGTLTNTATVAVPAGASDPSSANNSATDSDTVSAADATNDTPGSARNVLLGSTATDLLGSAAPDDLNWFRYRVRAGHSYCVEVDNGRSEVSKRNTLLTLYAADGATVIDANDDAASEPGASLLSRVCYIAAATESNLARVTAGAGNTTGTFRVRAVETTLFSPWFFSGSGYEAFILLKNTTGQAHTAAVTVVSPAGVPLAGVQSGAVPGNGSRNLQVSAAPPNGFGLSGAFGGVLIAHDGPPGALIGNLTSLNFAMGVSFDTPAVPRTNYR